MNLTIVEAIKQFLNSNTYPDLAALYNEAMEVQINVAKGDGESIMQNYKGNSWRAFKSVSTGEIYKNIRIPRKADSEPEFRLQSEMSYSLEKHAAYIGMTGWDWINRESLWFGYDFDSIAGHSPNNPNTLTDKELHELYEKAKEIPWVTVRKSTSGSGYHFYVFVEKGFKTENHTEHAAAARSILMKMSSYCDGYNFAEKIDVCGGVLWVWGEKMKKSTDGLTLVKKGRNIKIDEIPSNWKDHLDVVKYRRTKVRVPLKDSNGNEIQDVFDQLASRNHRNKMDAEHKKFLADYEKFCRDRRHTMYWDNDNYMLVTHTIALQEFHRENKLKGIFVTNSSGSTDINCFAFPLEEGGWSVIRYGKGTGEHASWDYDGTSWTKIKYNVAADYKQTIKAAGGVEDPETGGYYIDSVEPIHSVAEAFGHSVVIPQDLRGPDRKYLLSVHKDGRLLIKVNWIKNDPESIPGWIKKGKFWLQLQSFKVEQKETFTTTTQFDDIIRHLVTGNNGAGWMIKSKNGNWIYERSSDAKKVIQNQFGFNSLMADMAIGSCLQLPWKLVNKPFVEEYPGNREWNLGSAQFAFPPSMKSIDELYTPTWNKVFSHCGKGLDPYILTNEWCIANNIKTGGDYLKCWAASMIQFPDRPLPYLFFYSRKQGSGKSTFHESLVLLLNGGVANVKNSITSNAGFNKEMEGSILCFVDEFNINSNPQAYDVLKDWITSKTLVINEKFKTPFLTKNTCHFVQTANDPNYCIILPGDTRIMLINTPPLTESVKRETLQDMLRKEANDMTAFLLKMQIPYCNDRLNIPVIDTAEKSIMQTNNASALESFIMAKCDLTDGNTIPYSEFYDRFMDWIDSTERSEWSKKHVITKLPPEIPRGRLKGAENGNKFIANISWKESKLPASKKFLQVGDWITNESI